MRSSLVYFSSYALCAFEYVGSTVRILHSRVSEQHCGIGALVLVPACQTHITFYFVTMRKLARLLQLKYGTSEF